MDGKVQVLILCTFNTVNVRQLNGFLFCEPPYGSRCIDFV